MSNYYDLSRPYHINDWNNLVRAVNVKLQNPPENTDCEPIDPIDEVSDPHIWSVGDIEVVRNKLIATCPDINFSEPMELWTPEMIDEIANALGETWCDCEEECTEEFKHSENGTMIQYADYDYIIYHGCPGGEYPQPPDIDARTLEGMQVAKPGLEGRIILIRYDPEELWGGRIGRGININCDGTLGSASQFYIKGSHGMTPWCPGSDWETCCGNQAWIDNVLTPWLEYAETVANLQVNFEIYTAYADCADCDE